MQKTNFEKSEENMLSSILKYLAEFWPSRQDVYRKDRDRILSYMPDKDFDKVAPKHTAPYADHRE